jgi:uncharacterized membrane protein
VFAERAVRVDTGGSTLTRVTADHSAARRSRAGRRVARKRAARGVLAIFVVCMGLAHLVAPAPFVRAMPPYLPWHVGLVYLSGVCEIVGGLGLLVPRIRVIAAWGLMALFVAVFPANVHMAVHADEAPLAAWVLWARLPFQAVFLAWAYWLTTPDVRPIQRRAGGVG